MIILISGASHTGKTLLSQKLLEKYKIPYMSIDHLKMGLIRSGNTSLTPNDDDLLTPYLWEIVKEMIKTAVENSQSLIIEGLYIPFDWKKDFEAEYLKEIRFYCLVMSEDYIRENHALIKVHASDIENRMYESELDIEEMIRDNRKNYESCKKYGLNCIFIDKEYKVDPEELQ